MQQYKFQNPTAFGLNRVLQNFCTFLNSFPESSSEEGTISGPWAILCRWRTKFFFFIGFSVTSGLIYFFFSRFPEVKFLLSFICTFLRTKAAYWDDMLKSVSRRVALEVITRNFRQKYFFLTFSNLYFSLTGPKARIEQKVFSSAKN